MFKTLLNQARIEFVIMLDGPLLIKSGKDAGLDPTLPDMQFVRAFYGGKETVFLPGSSLKGVMRNRSEQILRTLGYDSCLLFDSKSCNSKEKDMKQITSALERYKRACYACRMFGSTFLKSRISFADAYPDGEVKLGYRTNVVINRITGGSQNFFQPEVLEEGHFIVNIDMNNYFLWQLVLLLYVLKDMKDGFLGLGMGTTRGLGRVRIDKLKLCLKDFRAEARKTIAGYLDEDLLTEDFAVNYKKELYYYEACQEEGEIWGEDGWLEKVDFVTLISRDFCFDGGTVNE